MATNTPSPHPSDLPPDVDYAKDPETGRVYYIDHANETNSFIHPRLKEELPPNWECRMEPTTGKIFFVDHANKTTSRSHPRHKDFHRHSDSDVELQSPYNQCLDAEGRHFYTNDETKTTSWLSPVKLAELEATGILDKDTEVYGEDGHAWKSWILEDVAESGLNKGTSYWVNYRDGSVDWQSPEDKRIARQKNMERRAQREATQD
ncbi:WW [Glarea lozoyensis ATCC 20868]|uniref:WW n=1 Tax=Glarea lozoyensis (strain ATCC 20868 / MF5171) TaxID=1116229 RepID=S3DVR5_GLAL2|nr:WW [Glarea lozoyensis ATCC 20868]EPE30483.1 WW [Glarea lozoyensis ATCC 20868]